MWKPTDWYDIDKKAELEKESVIVSGVSIVLLKHKKGYTSEIYKDGEFVYKFRIWNASPVILLISLVPFIKEFLGITEKVWGE